MTRRFWMFAVLVLAALQPGCEADQPSSPAGSVADASSVVPELPAVFDSVAAVPDAKPLIEPDIPLDTGPSERGPSELGPSEPGPSEPDCAPGEGCFLDKCDGNDDCQSGWCVQHLGEKICSQTCIGDCPAGWACNQVTATLPDVVYICVSDFANLCRPCANTTGCQSVGGAEDVCLSYGAEGSFCGAGCDEGGSCPLGFSCQTATTVDGIEVEQCVADAGSCSCSASAVDLALWTPCLVQNDWGSCEGKRVCFQQGLADCDAAVPSEETCNGVDDDCDGTVDEATCDDDNFCTTDACDGETGCIHTPVDSGECLDGDACTSGDHCEAGACVGLPIVCDDGDPCTDDSCDGLGGCVQTPNQSECDDGDPCTLADSCSDAGCTGVSIGCECTQDVDCAALDDGDACNGTLICDTSGTVYVCAVDPATVVQCDPSDSICQKSWCDPSTGTCGLVADHDGFACSDEDQCTIGEGCSAGECIGGVALNCADNNVCTDDSCAPATGCSNTANSASCDDLSACTTGDQCALGSCVGGAQIACDDGNLCTDDACDASSGCTTTANQAACDDGNTCTTGDGCSGGWCLGTDALACDDGNACTVDACDPALGCTATPSGSACDDGDACTVGETCSLTGCTGGADVVCDDASACTTDSCDPISGCVAIPVDGDCDDLNACTTADSCLAGECVGGVPLVCDDANDCTTDSCDPAEGCVAAPGASSCDDGNPCTVDDYCVLAVCFSGTIAGCNDGNVCTDDGCEAGSGCTFTPNDGACDDDNECTVGDACVGVWCLSTGPAECDDGVACTADVCTPGVGCGHHPDDPSCDDGDACTTSSCDMTGGCTSGPVPDCNDLEICTTDSCDPAAGCVNEPNLLDCEDGAVCTDNDSCAGGVCVGGAAPTCDDEDPCTTDECVDGTGCVHTPIAPCCGNLIEEGGETCDDGNQSPNDGCSPQCQVELGNCSNGSSTDCNVVGTTLIPSSAFVDPNPPAGWEQCAGFINTGGDDVANAFLNNCLNSNRLRIRVWNGNTLEEDVLSSNIASHTVWPAWNYLGGGMTKLVSTFWTGGTTFFSTTNGSDACSTGCCTSAPNGTLTLGTGNGSSAIVAPGNTDASEWRVNCSGQSLPGRKLAFYR